MPKVSIKTRKRQHAPQGKHEQHQNTTPRQETLVLKRTQLPGDIQSQDPGTLPKMSRTGQIVSQDSQVNQQLAMQTFHSAKRLERQRQQEGRRFSAFRDRVSEALFLSP